MKNFILLLAFILISTVHAGTCTSISRTNSASLSVLTSTKYNTDLNTVYAAANALDGGCITDGTLESGALNTTQFAPLLKGLQQGCKVIYSNASTVQIDKCIASVNGNFVTTTTTTNAAFGCSGCSAEVASTAYYVYIQTGSTGSTLTPLILTTAPNNDGYDNTGNKVLARFYNNGSSNIDTYSIDQWHISEFIPQNTGWVDGGTITIGAVTTAPTKGTASVDNVRWRREGGNLVARYRYRQTVGGANGSGSYLISLPNSYTVNETSQDFDASNSVSTIGRGHVTNQTDGRGSSTHTSRAALYSSSQFVILRSTATTGTQDIIGSGLLGLSTTTGFVIDIEVPISNWSY